MTGETNFFLLTNRYRPLADYLTGHLKGQFIEIPAEPKDYLALLQYTRE